MKMVTSSQVARRARVGRSTVSLVLNNHGNAVGISRATQERVQRAARIMGYTPSFAGQALRSQKAQNIGLLLSDYTLTGKLMLHSWGQRFAHLEPAIAARGYSLQVFRYEPASADRVLTQLGGGRVDGLVMTAIEDRRVLDLCRRMQLPCVDLVGTLGRVKMCSVEVDLVSARVAALRHAASMGHRRLAFAFAEVQYNRALFDAIHASAAMDPALRGCVVECLVYPAHTENPGEWTLNVHQSRPSSERPTVLLANDGIIHSFITALASRGLRCPHDVSAIGLSHSVFSDALSPRLTSIDNRGEEACNRAVTLVVDAVESGRMLSAADSPPPLECRLVVGESCRPPHEFGIA